LDLHIGCYKVPVFDRQDLGLVVEDSRAFFALLQDTITDITYNFYARSSDDSENVKERGLISKVVEAILRSSSIERIHGHAHVASSRHRRGAWNTAIWGFGVALPFFTSPTHLRSIMLTSSDVRGSKVSYLLRSIPEGIRPTRCSFKALSFPEDDLKKLPPSLNHLSLMFAQWLNVGSRSWMIAMAQLTEVCPDLVSLEMNTRDAWNTSSTAETIGAITPDVHNFITFPKLHSLKLICDDQCVTQTGLGHAFRSLQASALATITLQGSPSWFCLSSVDVNVLTQRTQLETVTFIEQFGIWAMESEAEDYPWSHTPDVVSISRPLFQDVVGRLEAAGVQVQVRAISNREEALDHGLTPDMSGFFNPLGTVEEYVQHMEVQFFQPDDNYYSPELEESYDLLRLQSLDVYCSMTSAFSQIARRWYAPNLQTIHVHVSPYDAREGALILTELTEMIIDRDFPSLCQLTGSFLGLSTSGPGDSLVGLFIDAFTEACEEHGVDIGQFRWI
jgi:hypothetical protein